MEITEYSSFVRGKNINGYTTLPEKTFDALENFILFNNEKDISSLEIMGLSAKNGIGKIITAKNYVGVISMNDGTTIEILPKIYSNEENNSKKAKKLLIDMLRTLENIPYKNLQTTNVNIEKMNIFEIFIRMFIDEIIFIVKKGLNNNYSTIQSNEYFFKGRMKFEKHIKYNFVHKERNYIEYDVFNVNTTENKILKTTLKFLYKITTSNKNKKDIKILLSSFNEVDDIYNYLIEYERLKNNRNISDYKNALMWSKIFLLGNSFTSFSGSQIAFALLFPMEKLFESYIVVHLKRYLDKKRFNIRVQDRKHHLFEYPERKFLIKPDIVIENKENNNIYILDTKWKILNQNKSNCGISQNDMYQMYAYHKKYEAKNITLIYPLTEKINTDLDLIFYTEDNVKVKVVFIDLFNIEKSINNIIKNIN